MVSIHTFLSFQFFTFLAGCINITVYFFWRSELLYTIIATKLRVYEVSNYSSVCHDIARIFDVDTFEVHSLLLGEQFRKVKEKEDNHQTLVTPVLQISVCSYLFSDTCWDFSYLHTVCSDLNPGALCPLIWHLFFHSYLYDSFPFLLDGWACEGQDPTSAPWLPLPPITPVLLSPTQCFEGSTESTNICWINENLSLCSLF